MAKQVGIEPRKGSCSELDGGFHMSWSGRAPCRCTNDLTDKDCQKKKDSSSSHDFAPQLEYLKLWSLHIFVRRTAP